MKNISFIISLLILLSTATYSQETFKKSLETITTDLCSKMTIKGKKKVVVLFVTDINKAQTTIGKYVADVVSFYIVNSTNGFSVFDRENLTGITEAKKLMAEGYIDAINAKQLGKILSVEAIIIGNYTVLSNSLALTLKALDVNDGFVIAQSMKEFVIDKDAATLLGINIGSDNSLDTSNRGFNGLPINSNEIYNDKNTVSQDCNKFGYGNYCFTNNTNNRVVVHFKKGTMKSLKKLDSNNNPMFYDPHPGLIYKLSLTLEPKQTQCIYELRPGPCSYEINSDLGKVFNGEVYIEQCKSKTFVIK